MIEECKELNELFAQISSRNRGILSCTIELVNINKRKPWENKINEPAHLVNYDGTIGNFFDPLATAPGNY